MRKFVVFALICVMAFAVVSFAKTEATVDPSGKSDAMYYSATDVFGDIVRTIPSTNPGTNNAWVGMAYADGELLMFKNVYSPQGVTMDRVNPNTGAIIATVQMLTGAYIMDADFDGTNVWVCQWSPTGAVKCIALDGTPVSSFVPAVTGSPRAVNFDMSTGNLWIGTNYSSNSTYLYEMTSTGTVLNTWTTGTVVGWYMGFVQALDAPAGSQMVCVDNVGNTIKRLTISGSSVTIAAQVAAPSVTPDVGEGLAYDGDHLIHCGAYASAGLVWFIDDGFVPADPLAPAAPTDFNVHHNNATLMATLAWTLPTLTVNGQPLSPNQPITMVKVERNNVVVATLGATATGYNDNVPSAGLYSYKVYAVNSYGNGLPVNASAWIGLDVPAAPSGVTAAVAGLNVNVAWTAPTQGAHMGYWPAGSWTGQKVYRNTTLAATLTGTNTTYVDTPPVEGDYVYSVLYYNASGDGPAGAAPSVHAGPIAYAASSIPFAWIEINPNAPGFQYTGTNTGLAADDANAGPFPLGFGYSFYGNNYTTFRVCTNGWASFSSSLTSYSNIAIPSPSAPLDLLGIYWDDMNMSAQGTCWYYYDATNSRCIIEWYGIAAYGTTPPGSYTFEIIINQTGIIDFQYKALTAGYTTQFATVGLQNATGTTGLQTWYNGAGTIAPAPRTGIRFAPPGGQPTWDVNIAPVAPPITIPANGGTFAYTLNVHNLGTTPGAFFVWNKVRNGAYNQTVFGPITRTIAGGASPTRTMNQNIAAGVPSGTCTYTSYVGTNSTVAVDSSWFTFTKSALADGGPWIADNNCYGNFLDEFATDVTPNVYALSEAYPNPFNPTTTLSFTLANAGVTKLAVFDVSGREVATLVNGYRDAGSHSVTFDASKLASGIYIYRLTAGDFNASGKMVLMK